MDVVVYGDSMISKEVGEMWMWFLVWLGRMLGIRRGDLGTYFRRSQFEPLVSTILDDPVLADVPKNATVADIDTLIGVELGSAMKLSILKLDGTQFGMCFLPFLLVSVRFERMGNGGDG